MDKDKICLLHTKKQPPLLIKKEEHLDILISLPYLFVFNCPAIFCVTNYEYAIFSQLLGGIIFTMQYLQEISPGTNNQPQDSEYASEATLKWKHIRAVFDYPCHLRCSGNNS